MTFENRVTYKPIYTLASPRLWDSEEKLVGKEANIIIDNQYISATLDTSTDTTQISINFDNVYTGSYEHYQSIFSASYLTLSSSGQFFETTDGLSGTLVNGNEINVHLVSGTFATISDMNLYESQYVDSILPSVTTNYLTTSASLDSQIQTYQNQYSNIDNQYFNSLFGDGSDGNVILSSSTLLQRDMYYNNLTLSATSIRTNGYTIRVANTLILSASALYATGSSGKKGGVVTPGIGGLGGHAPQFHLRGMQGANATTSSGSLASSTIASQFAVGGKSGAGGMQSNYVSSGSFTFTSGTVGFNRVPYKYTRLSPQLFADGNQLILGGQPGAGGSSGGSVIVNSASYRSSGGGGGAPGGLIKIFAKNIIVAKNTFGDSTSYMIVVGGNGGQGETPFSTQCAPGSGGAGASGGLVYLVYETRTHIEDSVIQFQYYGGAGGPSGSGSIGMTDEQQLSLYGKGACNGSIQIYNILSGTHFITGSNGIQPTTYLAEDGGFFTLYGSTQGI